MAFFEQLGATITNASNSVSQKTKNFTEINNLNKAISANQSTIQNLYSEIGRMYFEAHKEDPNAEYAQQCAGINEALANIAGLQDQIRVIKGISNCPNCGAEVANGSMFCASCGTQIPQPAPVQPAQPAVNEQPAVKFCAQCGTQVSGDSAFCPNCGQKM